MFIKHAVPVAVIAQHTGLVEVLSAREITFSPFGGAVGAFQFVTVKQILKRTRRKQTSEINEEFTIKT